MKGDFSQAALDGARFSRVVAQQGRVQLDSDWNEQQAIIDYRLRTALADIFGHGELVGRAVVPQADAGFGVHVHTGRVFGGGEPAQPVHARLDASQPYSIECWIRPDAVEASSARTIAAFYVHQDLAIRVSLDGLGCVTFECADTEKRTQRLVSTRSVSTDGYTFVACVFTGDAVEIWIDGKVDRRAAAGAGAQHEHFALYAGTLEQGSEPFAGAIEAIHVLRGRRFHGDLREAFLRHERALDETREGVIAHWKAAHEDGARIFSELCIGPGRCYVDGLLCRAESHATLKSPELQSAESHQRFLVFVDAWERYVSAFEDASLRDPALAGLDTMGRLRTMAVPYVVPMDDPGAMLGFLAALDHDRAQIAVDLADNLLQSNQLYRFEAHAGGSAATVAPPNDAVSFELLRPDDSANAGNRRKIRLPQQLAAAWECGQFLQLVDQTGAASGTILQVASCANRDADGEWMFVDNVPAGLIGTVRVRPIASMLWSKDNGHAVFPIDRVITSDDTTTIDLFDEAGRASLLNIGDVVVITSEDRIQAFHAGIATTIANVSTNVPGMVSVVVPVSITDPGAGATLRRWDGLLPALAQPDTKPAITGDLTVRFSDSGVYRAGDYWLARIRPDADAPLDWRYDPHRVAAFLPPFGIAHVYAPLAFVEVRSDGPHVVKDLRHAARSTGDFDGAPSEVMREFEWPQPAVTVQQVEHRHTHEKIVERVSEQLPDDAFVLTRRAAASREGVEAVVEARVEHLEWRTFAGAAQSGSAQAVQIDGNIYVLYADGALWRFNPAEPQTAWKRCSPLAWDVHGSAVCAAGGKIYVLGGADSRGRVRREVYAYDPYMDAWASVAPMRKARARAAVAGDAGRVIVFGGTRRGLFGWRYLSRTVEEYLIDDDAWRMLEPMPFRRTRAAAVRWGASILLIGGLIGESLFGRARPTPRIDRFVRRTLSWREHLEMSETRVNPRAAAVGSQLIVLGDGSGAERIDLLMDDVQPISAKARDNFGFAAVSGAVYVISGVDFDGTPANDVQACTIVDRFYVYRPQTQRGDA